MSPRRFLDRTVTFSRDPGSGTIEGTTEMVRQQRREAARARPQERALARTSAGRISAAPLRACGALSAAGAFKATEDSRTGSTSS
ncbi:MAG: hypothetical protein AVDCRST_MAG42-1268 [uncultured Chthoniobacterales bacterium]|uniref:Uncharacterized protein n=1 Tax=uncultured Chthoniobacterales bacterium TaxID=1836801 RepID=A0A6J4HUA3_9BACT|nr:MAG: hypothetical protein AVDCRST_MAG42-1268 [uncultured Chthoniobacterales bacterium]